MNDMDIIDGFEKTIAEFAGAKYGVAVSSQTNAVFLCLQYVKRKGEILEGDTITIPSRTYLSIPCQIKHCGFKINFVDKEWSGLYYLEPTRVIDSAVRFTEDMYEGKFALQCISFQYRKALKLGRGGMVLTDDEEAYKWLKQAVFNGRHVGVTQHNDILDFAGWNMYMLPEDAARGLTLFSIAPRVNEDIAGSINYPDLSDQKVFK